MIEPTKERLEQLRDAIRHEADTLPEYSHFGDKNDLEGSRMLADFIQWVIDNFDDKEALRKKEKELASADVGDDDLSYDRHLGKEEVMGFALGNGDTFFTDHCGDA